MLEGYITPLLMSYLDKYVKNIKPSDLKLSFWGGDAVLRNLELRLDVLERELGIPLEFRSGCIRELTLHIPWNAIGSSSVEVTVKDIEFVIKLKSLRSPVCSSSTLSSDKSSSDADAGKAQPDPSPSSPRPGEKGAEPAPGYLQGYLNRITNNVCVRVQNMVVKVIEEESNLKLTLNVGSLDFHTTNQDWKKEFVYTDYFQGAYTLYKLLAANDVTINLHPMEMTEKGQGSQLHEPLMARTGLECRVRLECEGKVSVARILEVVFGSVELGMDERQFCLCLHLSDWCLAMYYSSKKLKGRDHNPYVTPPESRGEPAGHGGGGGGGSGSETGEGVSRDHAPHAEASGKDERGGGGGGAGGRGTQQGDESKIKSSGETGGVTPPQDSSTGSDGGGGGGGGGGWGTWFLSYIGPSDSGPDISESDSQLESRERELREPSRPKTRLIIRADSLTVLLKMTQQVQVPVFVRSFTSPVLRVTLSRCLFRLDRCPTSKLFLVCLGVGGVRGEVMGLCPCVKRFPSSWRRTSVASATDTCQVVSIVDKNS